MTHDPSPEAGRLDAPAPKPYESPTLTALGAVDAVTAGPDGGNIDQIFGGSGGFQQDGTS